jgi:hypothetical protein
LPVAGKTLLEDYMYFDDDESYKDEKGTACNLHVTKRKCVQNFGQNFSKESLFENFRHRTEDKIKIDLEEREQKCVD